MKNLMFAILGLAFLGLSCTKKETYNTTGTDTVSVTPDTTRDVDSDTASTVRTDTATTRIDSVQKR